MTEETGGGVPVEAPLNRRLAILLAMAMFVLVVDTSLMNVSIAAVVRDLDTTVSGVQSAIALEALVSAAFILIGSKVGDLIGRKKAYVLGLLGYAVGAAGDDPGPGPDRDHHLLGGRRRARRVAAAAGDAVPDPRQLPGRGAEEGVRPGRRRRGDRRRGRAAAGRVHHHLPVLAGRVPARSGGHRGRAVRHQTRPGRALHRAAGGRRRRRGPVRAGHGRHRARHPGVAGRRRSGRRAARGRRGRDGRVRLLAGAPQTPAQGDADRPGPVPVQGLPVRHHRADAAADRAGRHHDRAADLPADGAGVQRHAGRSVAWPRCR